MPANLVKGPDGEEAWEKSKADAAKAYPELAKKAKAKKLSKGEAQKFWGTVTKIYKARCKNEKYNCESMSEILVRLESRS
jgi:hypothetical protein